MVALPVEAVLVVYYGPEAHRATYGRQVKSNRYTKDYIQLSRRSDFLDAVARLFPVDAGSDGTVPITYVWPGDSAPGAFVFLSGDRPHLKWETRDGAPSAWKMAPAPAESSPETIPGDPSLDAFEGAEAQFAALAVQSAGQPYLMAIKLRDQPTTLHLRAYLANPGEEYSWGALALAPPPIQDLAAQTSQTRALAWALFQSGGSAPTAKTEAALQELTETSEPESVIEGLDDETGRAVASYLRSPGYGLFFDPSKNHDAWTQPAPLPEELALSAGGIAQAIDARFPVVSHGDAAAESVDPDPTEVDAFREQIDAKDYGVADATATVKTRGSAQKAFAEAVKTNYGYRCAITGISTKDFLVASHIVPWSDDQSIRLDPSNGICLSLFVDRAFEKGYLRIEDDLKIRIDWTLVDDDSALRELLIAHDGKTIRKPANEPPQIEYLQRRRALIDKTT